MTTDLIASVTPTNPATRVITRRDPFARHREDARVYNEWRARHTMEVVSIVARFVSRAASSRHLVNNRIVVAEDAVVRLFLPFEC